MPFINLNSMFPGKKINVVILLLCLPFLASEERSASDSIKKEKTNAWKLKPLLPLAGNDTPSFANLKNTHPGNNASQTFDLKYLKEELTRSEYHIRWQSERHAYSSPNRNQELRFDYSASGFHVEPRAHSVDFPEKAVDLQKTRDKEDWFFSLSIQTWGKNKKMVPSFIPEDTCLRENYISYSNKLFQAEYKNTTQGMRQNFIVKEQPQGNEKLRIQLQLESNLIARVENNVLLLDNTDGEIVCSYGDLNVWDAAHNTLNASMVFNKRSNSLVIEVDDAGATYPVTIDPIVANGTPANANSTMEGNQAGADLGFTVSTAGDVNGDGYSDVIVGAYEYDKGSTDEGAAFVFHGSATGINTSGTPANANSVIESNQAGALMGFAVSTAGDVNGDGYSDVVVVAWTYTNGQASEGAAFVYHGSSSGIVAAGTPANANSIIETNQASAEMYAATTADDVNNDGYSDLIVGAHFYDNGNTNEGIVLVFHGSSTGVIAAGTPANANSRIECNQDNAEMGIYVNTAGDVNGDGYSDVVACAFYYDNGQTDEGTVLVFHGSSSGITASGTPANANSLIESNQASARMGNASGTAGDVNGDGYSDIVVGCQRYTNGQSEEGIVLVFHGSSTGIVASGTPSNDNGFIESNQAAAWLGHSCGSAGDVNGDGYSDIILGAPYYDNGSTDEGIALVFHGSSSGITTSGTPANANSLIESNQASTSLGWNMIGSAGDVNGDGFSDVIVGAYLYDAGTADEGAAWVFHGSAQGLGSSLTVADANCILQSNQATAELGYTLANAGDVNGDGYSDMMVSSHYYDNGSADEGIVLVYNGSASGFSAAMTIAGANSLIESNQASARLGYHDGVETAGDVNGDGYDDIIIGAYQYDIGESNEGAAFIYHGSSTGIVAAGTPANANSVIQANQADANLGLSVASAGDINSDGYNDVLVGAFHYDNGQSNEGVVLVYHGSPTGIVAAGTPANAAVMVQSNQADGIMGNSVATAGDVNGDGYSDIIVCAYDYDKESTDEGAAFIFHGSATGIVASPSPANANSVVESNQTSASMAYFATCAGDVNGDGYSDVVIAAKYYDNGQTNEGAAFVYHGSSTGIVAAGTPANANSVIQSNQTDAVLQEVSSAGDYNGDGYADILVGIEEYDNGSTDEGIALLFNGSSSGITAAGTPANANVLIDCNQTDGDLGAKVSPLGDVNGDGFCDFGIGAYGYGNGQSEEGHAFVYYGNNATSKKYLTRQLRVDLSTPLQANGSGYNFSQFGISQYVWSAYGRVRAKLSWEVKGNGVAFSGTPITNGLSFSGTTASWTDIGTTGTTITQVINKTTFKRTRWRVRIKYHTAKMPFGQPYSRWFYGTTVGSIDIGILPVEILSFDASCKEGSININWATASETNNDYFTLERSTDAANWVEFREIKGAGNSKEVRTYHVVDNDAGNRNVYYRLKQTDFNGTVTPV